MCACWCVPADVALLDVVLSYVALLDAPLLVGC